MITFQTYNNIIISKRTNNPSHTKNYSNTKKEKEKSTNNFIRVKDYYLNGVNNCFNKSTLSLTSLKLKSIVPTKTQNIKTNQFTKNSTNINSIKITKTKDIIENNSQKINIINDNAKDLSANNKKTRLNRNANCINDNYLFLYGTNNNDNLSTNYISINDNKLDLNLYPKPEPMPIKICKNNYFYNNIKCNSNRNANINNIFSPEYIISNIDNENNADFNDDDEYNKFQNEKKYFSTLKKFVENNNLKDNKKYRYNKKLIKKNNFKNFLENTDNTNDENRNKIELIKNNEKELEIYDTNVDYILKHLDLDNLINIFSSHCIKFNDLFLLTKQDFIEMNVPIGQRNRFLLFLEKYKNFATKFDFQEVKLFLDKYKCNNNNLFIEKNMSNLSNHKKNNHENDDIKYNMNDKYINKDNELKRIIDINSNTDINRKDEPYHNININISNNNSNLNTNINTSANISQQPKIKKQIRKLSDCITGNNSNKLGVNISNFEKKK